MIVKPSTFAKLSAIDKNNNLISIPNMVLRKQIEVKQQDFNLNSNSICLVCNFRFRENKIKWSKKVKAICHPFRFDDIFPANIKKYLFSESDFCDKLITTTSHKMEKWNEVKYDFVYFTLISREGTRSKGLYLLPLINEVAGKLGLKGLVVNYSIRETAKHKGTIYHKSLNQMQKAIPSLNNLTFFHKKYKTDEVCAIMLSSKFVLLPSDADASPRLIVESLVRNRPLVMNDAIYGGWKYINDNTGVFFEAPTIQESYSKKYNKDYEIYRDSLEDAMIKVLSIGDKVSANFYEKYGFLKTSIRLAKIINSFSGTTYKAVAYKEWKKQLNKISNKIRD